jgi:hypothetical protein
VSLRRRDKSLLFSLGHFLVSVKEKQLGESVKRSESVEQQCLLGRQLNDHRWLLTLLYFELFPAHQVMVQSIHFTLLQLQVECQR